MRRPNITPGFVPAAVLAFAGLATPAHAQVQYTTIALTGQPAGVLPGITYNILADPRLGDNFTTAFWSQLAPNVPLASDNALWVDRGSGIELVSREGDAAPGAGVFGFPGVQLSADGLLRFTFALKQTPVGPTRVAFAVEPAPQSPPLIIDTEPTQTASIGQVFSFPIPRTDDGQSAYVLSASTSTPAVLITPAGNIINGDPAPIDGTTLPAGSLFRRFTPPVMNAAGDMVFRAWAGDQVAAITWRQGIWKLSAGSLTPVAIVAEGDPSPDAGYTFRDLTPTPQIDDNGRVLFQTRLVFGTLANTTGLYRWESGAHTRLILTGQEIAASGLHAGIISSRFAATATGAAAVLVPIAEGAPAANAVIVRFAADNTPSIVIREGDAAPGLAPATIGMLSEPRLSAAGGLAFLATVAADPARKSSLFAQAREGSALLPVASIGETFTPPGGTAKVVRDLSFDHQQQPIGQSQFVGRSVAFKLSFADESCALLRADLPAPDPIADINLDGQLTLEDFFAFFNAFDNSLPPADIDGTPGITLEDYFAFFNSWDA